MTDQKDRDIFGIHRTTLLVIAVAITFGSFSVYKALGIGRTERSEVRAVSAPVSGTALLAGEYVTVANTNPLASAARLTNVPRPALNTTLTPIEQIQVGARVLAESPTGEEDTAFGSEIISSDWRKLTLRAPKRDGTVAEVVLLRPLTWLNEQHGEVGGTVFISVPECGIDGNAEVLAIDSCPAIPSGAGRVVTGTFLHQARSTITLTIAGQSEPIECTGNHPFWSEDRQTFVRADSLHPNETLRTSTGLTTVESWTPDLNPTPVYNIEVHGAHVYHVGTSGVVVHNGTGLPCLDAEQYFNPLLRSINADDLASAAAKGFRNGECKECADAILGAVTGKGLHGSIIDVQTKMLDGRNSLHNIWSDLAGANISTNGTHRAVLIGDTVFDNMNPNGIGLSQWLNDLFSPVPLHFTYTPF